MKTVGRWGASLLIAFLSPFGLSLTSCYATRSSLNARQQDTGAEPVEQTSGSGACRFG
jgi:hypothetical protein